MKKTDLAYAAGIVDGEGCIYIRNSRHNKYGKKFYDLAVSVSSIDEWLCRYLQMMFGGAVSEVSRALSYQHKNYSRTWCWRVMTKQALIFLELILPYLYIKRPQAELAIKFQSAKINRGKKLTDGERVLQEAQYILMKNLKVKPKLGEVWQE